MTKYLAIALLLTCLHSYAGSLMCPTTVKILAGGGESMSGPWPVEVNYTGGLSTEDCLNGRTFKYTYTLEKAPRPYRGLAGYNTNITNTFANITGQKTPVNGSTSHLAEMKFTAAGGNTLGYSNYYFNDAVDSQSVGASGYGLRPEVEIKLYPFKTTDSLEGTQTVNLRDIWGYTELDTYNTRSLSNELVITYTAINEHSVNAHFTNTVLSCEATTGNTCTTTTTLRAANNSDTETLDATLTFNTTSNTKYEVEIEGLERDKIPLDTPIKYKIPPLGAMTNDTLTMKIRGQTGRGTVTINAVLTVP